MKRGFTLLEILVVVSTMCVLSSIIVASISPARVQARDSVRVQQVRQIDLAVQLYKANNNGNAPDLDSSCDAQIEAMQFSDVVPGCVAVSTQGVSNQTDNLTPWGKLQKDLKPYLSSLPNDPCGSNCPNVYGNALGYTYYSPAYLQAGCGSSCNQSLDQLNQEYQLSAQLEGQNSQTGGSNTSSIPAPPVINNFLAGMDISGSHPEYPNTMFSFMWNTRNTFPTSQYPCVLSLFYDNYPWYNPTRPEPASGGDNTSLAPDSVTLTCYGPGGVVTKSLSGF